MQIRFAILAGVSTDPQAHEDKMSIPDQVENCRKFIAANDGAESCGPYIMDGYSRSGYDSLDTAMREIPPLGAAIRDASANKYDILIMDHFDRLGDLGLIALVRFKKIRKQLHSVRQSGRVIPPDQYNPYESENADMQMRMHGIVQVYRINKIRRAWETGVPDRAAAGLHSLSTSYGYKARGKNEPAEPIPEKTDLIIQMKNWFLQGITLQEICNRANTSGVKPQRAKYFTRTVVKRIITNPYYAGLTIFGKQKKEDGKRIPQPPSQWVRGQGKHQPLWDEKTYYAILAEVERRDSLRMRSEVYALTGVLECSVCGTKVHRHGKHDTPWIYLHCRAEIPHISLRYDAVLPQVAAQMVSALRRYRETPAIVNDNKNFEPRIQKQRALRQRVQDGYEQGIYTHIEAQKKIVAIETEIERLTRARDRAAQQQTQKNAMLQFAGQDLERIEQWIVHDDPATVNKFLTSLCEKIIITPQGELTVVWRS